MLAPFAPRRLAANFFPLEAQITAAARFVISPTNDLPSAPRSAPAESTNSEADSSCVRKPQAERFELLTLSLACLGSAWSRRVSRELRVASREEKCEALAFLLPSFASRNLGASSSICLSLSKSNEEEARKIEFNRIESDRTKSKLESENGIEKSSIC